MLPEYVALSAFRFLDQGVSTSAMRRLYDDIIAGKSVDIADYRAQAVLVA